MHKILQQGLLALGVIALVALLADIVYSLVMTAHTSTPARVVQVKAGSYPLTVSFSRDPASAGYALPFTISAPQALTYKVTSEPTKEIDATPVSASISPGSNPNEVLGNAEVTVRGLWKLHILVNGPQGSGEAIIPIQVSAPPAIPAWSGWLIGGGLPLACFLVFLIMQMRSRPQQTVAAA
jgi:hypothetical protein